MSEDQDTVNGKPVKASGVPPTAPTVGTAMDQAIARRVAQAKASRPRVIQNDVADASWPIDLDPKALTAEAPTLSTTQQYLETLGKSAVAMAETFNVVTPAERPLWHTKAMQASKTVVSSASSQLGKLESAITTAEAAVSASLKPKPEHVQFGAELRNIVRTDKMALSALAIADFETVSAVLAAPARASGLTEADHKALRAMAAKRFAPEQLQRVEAIQQHHGKLKRALELYTERVGTLLRKASPQTLNDTLAKIG